jgi:redox-sensitive bicupin YhaK (pirin superfamily)
VGSAFGLTSPVVVRSPTLYIDIALQAGDALPLPLAEERAVYVVSGAVTLDGQALPEQHMAVLNPGDEPLLAGEADARVVVIGGTPLGPRHLWWNFVASDPARLVAAAAEWAEFANGPGGPGPRFAPVPGETEFIPAPAVGPRVPDTRS